MLRPTVRDVAVLVTLERGRDAGGHVRCWERFGEAAADMPGLLHLTLHFLGPEERTEQPAENVRIARRRRAAANTPRAVPASASSIAE